MILGSDEDFASRRRCPKCRYGAAREIDRNEEEYLVTCTNCNEEQWVKIFVDTIEPSSFILKKSGHSISKNFYKGTTGKMAY